MSDATIALGATGIDALMRVIVGIDDAFGRVTNASFSNLGHNMELSYHD